MPHNINRRKFIKNTAAGSAGILLGTTLSGFSDADFSKVTGLTKGIMGITPISLMEDACLLALRTGKITGDSEYALVSDLHSRPAAPGNKGRLASHLPVNDRRLLDVLQNLKANAEIKNYIAKIALTFGWICNNACHKYLKQAYGNNPSEENIAEIQLYHDAEIVKTFTRDNISGKVSQNELASLFNEILPRAITRIHTLKPAEDGMEWVNRISAWRVENKEYLDKLAFTVLKPDKIKHEEYILNSGFHLADDPAIYATKMMRKAEYVSRAEVKTALEVQRQESLCGKAIAESSRNIITASGFLNGDLSTGELDKALFSS